MIKNECLLAYSGAQSFINLIDDYLDNKITLQEMFQSSNYSNICNIIEALEGKSICMNCEGCLDYVFLSKIMTDFIIELEKIYKSNINLLVNIFADLNKDKEFYEIYDILLCLKDIKIVEEINIITKSKYKAELEKINKSLNTSYLNLKESFYSNRISDCNDKINGLLQVLSKRKINQTNWRNTNNQIVYFDKQVFSKYISDKKIQKKIEDSKNKNFTYVYSPYILEDDIRSNYYYTMRDCEYITKLTDNKIIAEPEYIVKIEDPKICFNRVSLFNFYTKAAEEKRVYQQKVNRLHYEEVFTEIKRNSCLSWNELIELILRNKEIKNRIEGIINFNRFSFTLDDLQIKRIISSSIEDKIKIIDNLFDFFDMIGYQCDNSEKTLKSGLQDKEHIKCAIVADYFITEDKKLRARVEIIYELLGISTKVLDINTYCELIA